LIRDVKFLLTLPGRDIVNSCVWEVFQAATLGRQIPSMKIVP
jgi:hypothetical protein